MSNIFNVKHFYCSSSVYINAMMAGLVRLESHDILSLRNHLMNVPRFYQVDYIKLILLRAVKVEFRLE